MRKSINELNALRKDGHSIRPDESEFFIEMESDLLGYLNRLKIFEEEFETDLKNLKD